MAGPIEQPGPVALLEDAAHLLRRASFGARVVALDRRGAARAGSADLLEQPDAPAGFGPGVRGGSASAGAVADLDELLARRLFRAPVPGTDRRARKTVDRAEDLAAGGRPRHFRPPQNPSILPLALAAIFPFTDAVAFYRYNCGLAGRDELDPPDVMAKARKPGAPREA